MMPLNSDQDAIHQLRQLVQKAENCGDADLMAAVLAEDITVIVPGSPVLRGKNNAVNFIKAWFEAFNIQITYTTEATSIAGNLAYEWAQYQQETTAKAGGQKASETGRILWIYKQYGGKWLQHFVIWNTL